LLFKSFQEGNSFIRLSNISLTSKKELDRNIYSFTATATEVQEANDANYRKFFSNLKEDLTYVLTRLFVKASAFNGEAVTISNDDLVDLDESYGDDFSLVTV